MLFKTKEAVNAAARNVANNLVEAYNFYSVMFTDSVEPVNRFQGFIQSADWNHVYNLIQRNAFVNLSEVHHMFISELTQVIKSEHLLDLNFRFTDKGINLIINSEVEVPRSFEVWSLGAAIDGVELKSPLNP